MPEQPAEIQRINWSSCFAFTQVFRTFKMALHPGKLGLALVALLLVGLWGLVLDGIWSGSRHKPLADEINAFWQTPDIEQWRQEKISARLDIARAAFAHVNVPLDGKIQDDLKSASASPEGVGKALKLLKEKGYEHLAVKDLKPEDRANVAKRFAEAYRQVEALQTRGISESFWKYEAAAIRQFVSSAAQMRFTDGLTEVFSARRETGGMGTDLLVLQRAGRGGASILAPDQANVGAAASLVLMARGVHWLVERFPWYTLLFCLGTLAIFAFFGGAICRMAALNFARDERIPLKTALAFARRKFIGFATAPLLPIGMILGLGVLLAIGGLVGAIPAVGGVITGALLFLALAAGFVMALVLIGFLGGGSLMWPTIAVEGSDSFDAMSRSYSYVYSRPWKAALYALVATVYGAICYLFVHFFVWVMLWITRYFVGKGMCWTSRPGTGLPGGTKIDSLWMIPTFDELIRTPSPFAAMSGDTPGQWLIQLWVGLVVLLLAAFLVVFYFCASTVIYYLLRREVDATDLEDVYSEDVDEEARESGPAPTETGAAPAPVAVAAAPGSPTAPPATDPPPQA